ncbi:MAG: glucose-1-phosphate adenylyltransferase [Clostridiales bacterium]|nr:glucose-1-phosphate adenylyltransferase [Clostridiales bacterium]
MIKKCVAMLLAGGQGTRLYALTTRIAKPAVSFGSKYRIIDFPLSNCANSGIDTVGVLTQYQPMVLNEYLGNGEPWNLDRSHGGLHVLPPYLAKSGGEWYKGTANAIYQNAAFLNAYEAEHVLILSGDHIYKMDYSKMLEYHIEKNADCTIAVLDVPMEEAKRFGILSFDDEGRITEFAEKPKVPKSNHASMGIYIFKQEVLLDELSAEERNPDTQFDFGKNVIPAMIKSGRRMYAYRFNGYWKDVGTLRSLWEANMDILSGQFDLNDGNKIYSRNQAYPPSFMADDAKVKNSVMTAGCEVYGEVVNSVLGEGVIVAPGARVIDSVIMRDSVIGKGSVVSYSIIDEGVHIGERCKIGGAVDDTVDPTLIGRDKTIDNGTTIGAGKVVE